MTISLSSPKYAKPESLAYQMYKKQKDRKKRKGILLPVTRYFRRNLGTIDYATHSTVTADRIVMDVVPDADNTGLPTGAPAVTAGLYQTIDFVYSGTISEIYRNGSDYFQGIIANVKYYFNGSLIHSWAIDDNSNTLVDSVGGNNATLVNPNPADWGLFTEQGNGEWLNNIDRWGKTNLASDWTSQGVALSDVAGGVSAVAADGASDRAERTIVTSSIESGRYYRFNISAARGPQGASQVFQNFTFATIPVIPITTQVMTPYVFDLLATASTGLIRVYAAASGSAGDEVIIGKSEVYEVLKLS